MAKARSAITNAIITELKKINGGNIAGGGTY